ncbi:hypothetical protein GGQ61_001351 [Phenylobacterium haematophilum]|uniref:Phytanoyl-CoA dioxygenase family protein n=1 Tax=Phenylobacterium haematophilum TaxID=98513 RepID=A0A839ZX61_9CAUL|nr:phytanoyl-CoA dioxygenase family protein [Phenylobacterium haematophilum]MBB3890634.1 hypothetical protein [Phenylobacterium haematophilum]
MSPLAMNRLETLSDVQVEQFREEGFLAVENVLPMTAVEQLRSRFEPLFAGDFDTGVYPDEWYWREELSKPDVTRHMANAWKADLTIAALSLSQDLGKAACRLTGWPSAKLGQDTIWWKPPGGKPIAYHQDTSFMDFLDPQETITFWFALDDVTRQTGTLEYARGSHKWPCTPMPSSFHAAGDYRGQLRAAAHAASAPMPDIYYAEVPAGSVVIHAGETWHGSGPNGSTGQMRRSIGVHLVSGQARFSDRRGGYIYRRYQISGDAGLNESFFPMLWSAVGARTTWLDDYCTSGTR